MWMVASLLFVALAFFAVGQAGAIRNTAQGAADAAALAGAQAVRDTEPWESLPDLTWEDWEDILEGKGFLLTRACDAADAFAGSNGAAVTECDPSVRDVWVRVQGSRSIDNPVVSNRSRATAEATAEITPRCRLGPKPEVPSDPGGEEPEDPVEEPLPLPPLEIRCDGEDLRLDPLNPGVWKDLARTLFTVQLVD